MDLTPVGTPKQNIKVINPDTQKVIDCTAIVEQLGPIYKNSPNDYFPKYIELLNNCVQWNDNIDNQINKLKEVLQSDGLNNKFKQQLDKVVLYANRKSEPYIPMIKKFKELYLAKRQEKGISLLCPEIDRLTGGISCGSICTIAGGPGCMKTTLAINIAYNAIKEGKNSCYITLEETPTQLYSKLLSRVSVDIGKPLSVQNVVQSKLDEKETKTLFKEVLPYLDNQKGRLHMLGDADFVSLEFNEIERILKIVDKEMINENGHGIDLLVVDHIQLLKYANNTKDEYKVANEYVSFFRKQSLSFLDTGREISVILLSQVNREGIAYAKGKPANKEGNGGREAGIYLMQHVAEASEIERASSYIISVYTDAMSQITKLLKIGAVKLRGAQLPLETINVFADGEFYQVGDTSIPEQESCQNGDLFTQLEQSQTVKIQPTSTNYSIDDMLSSKLMEGIDL